MQYDRSSDVHELPISLDTSRRQTMGYEMPADGIGRQWVSNTQQMDCQTGQGAGKQYLDYTPLEAEQGNRSSNRDHR